MISSHSRAASSQKDGPFQALVKMQPVVSRLVREHEARKKRAVKKLLVACAIAGCAYGIHLDSAASGFVGFLFALVIAAAISRLRSIESAVKWIALVCASAVAFFYGPDAAERFPLISGFALGAVVLGGGPFIATMARYQSFSIEEEELDAFSGSEWLLRRIKTLLDDVELFAHSFSPVVPPEKVLELFQNSPFRWTSHEQLHPPQHSSPFMATGNASKGRQFEAICARMFMLLDYGTTLVGMNGDGGVDILAIGPPGRLAVQCKCRNRKHAQYRKDVIQDADSDLKRGLARYKADVGVICVSSKDSSRDTTSLFDVFDIPLDSPWRKAHPKFGSPTGFTVLDARHLAWAFHYAAGEQSALGDRCEITARMHELYSECSELARRAVRLGRLSESPT